MYALFSFLSKYSSNFCAISFDCLSLFSVRYEKKISLSDLNASVPKYAYANPPPNNTINIITAIIIMIIIYLVATAKQPYVECSRKTTDDLGITVKEELRTELDNNKIGQMTLTKTITLPDKYLDSDRYLESIKFALTKSYAYLASNDIKISTGDNYVLVKITAKKSATLILNNIEFYEDNGLQMRINPNTKSSDVITLSINDKYTEGELMTHMKNNGYICK